MCNKYIIEIYELHCVAHYLSRDNCTVLLYHSLEVYMLNIDKATGLYHITGHSLINDFTFFLE